MRLPIFLLAGIASVTSQLTQQVEPTGATMPRRAARRPEGHERKALFAVTPMQFPATAILRKRLPLFSPTRQLSYLSELNDGPLHHAFLPGIAPGLE